VEISSKQHFFIFSTSNTEYLVVILYYFPLSSLYVNEAIKTTVNQSLDRDKYEIIVATNMDLPEREGVRIIKSKERWLGPKLAQGTEEAKGEVISVLDDDLFIPNKLEVLNKVLERTKHWTFQKFSKIYKGSR